MVACDLAKVNVGVRFSYPAPIKAPEALLAMQLICNQKIGGSIPSGGTKYSCIITTGG